MCYVKIYISYFTLMKNKLSLLALSLLSFSFISNSALADLRESFKNQSICTISNSQYVGSTLGGSNTYICVINNVVYRASDPSLEPAYLNAAFAGKKGVIGQKEYNQYDNLLSQFAIEGNELVRYICSGMLDCEGPVSRIVYAKKR